MSPIIQTCVTFCFCVFFHYTIVTNQTTVTTCITYYRSSSSSYIITTTVQYCNYYGTLKYMDFVIMSVTQPAVKIIFEDFKSPVAWAQFQ